MKDLFPTKKSFFTAIDRLDDSDNQDEDDKSWGSLLTFADKEPDKPKPNKVALSSERNPPRANSDPISSCDLQSKRSSPLAVSKPAPANRPWTTGTMPTIKSGGPPQKKRKTNSAKIIPVDQQIFKGLIFCKYSRFLLPTFTELLFQFSSQTTTYLHSDDCAFSERKIMVHDGVETGPPMSLM
jgi:DNA polymerase IV